MLSTADIISWAKRRPATKAAWLAGIVGFFALILNTYVLYQNSQTLSISKQALFQSMHPSVELQFSGSTAYLTNTSGQTLEDICIIPITYRFDGEYNVIERNQPRGNFQIKDTLLPQQRINVPEISLLSLREDRFNPSTNDPNMYRVAVITYRRSPDMRRFASLEIFQSISNNESVSYFGLFSGQKYGGWNGPPERYLKIIDVIQRTEKVLFKVESFE